MKIEKRISSFSRVGKILLDYSEAECGSPDCEYWKSRIDRAVAESEISNGWFTRDNLLKAIRENAVLLEEGLLTGWLQPWKMYLEKDTPPKTVGIIMAGNIPMVGFHDLLCVLLSGNRVKAKLSSNDPHLIPLVAEMLEWCDPGWKTFIDLTEGKMSGFDAMIATGSTNTSRYFEYYFGSYPHIIRKNRKSAAILTGRESDRQLKGLADDVFQYFGLGCRNVSKLYLPDGYRPETLVSHFQEYAQCFHHHKYRNNYDFHKSIYLVNRTPFFEGPFYMMIEDKSLSSPVSVINYEYYRDVPSLMTSLESHSEEIQCLVGDLQGMKGLLPFGSSQSPRLADYADNTDTLAFLFQKI
jgi:hypothetical protein